MNLHDYGSWDIIFYYLYDDSKLYEIHMKNILPLTRDSIKQYLPSNCQYVFLDQCVNSLRPRQVALYNEETPDKSMPLRRWVEIEIP